PSDDAHRAPPSFPTRRSSDLSPAVCAPGSGHSDDSRTRSRPETTRRATRAAGGPAGQRTGPPAARGDRGSGAYLIAGIGSVAEVVQSDRRAGGVAESVLGAVEAVAVIRDGVGGGAGLLGGLDGGVPVTVDAGARRDQLADDHVLLEAHQLVRALVDRGIGEHPGGLLEGGRREPRVRR